jgi:peptidoglycan L-alanyl-D-glutamate endopeptidase CwlK
MINSRNIEDMHPCLKRGARELTRRMVELGYQVGISSTYRDNEYQDYLYAQGRTREGNIVTSATGGKSIHNYRLAFDIFKDETGHLYDDRIFFEMAGKLWISMGGAWGGSWRNFPDSPHMEYTGGFSLVDLWIRKLALNDNAKMPWEEKELTQEEFNVMFNVALDDYKNRLNALPVSEWAKIDWETAVEQSIFDGSAPRGALTREQAAAVLRRVGLLKN